MSYHPHGTPSFRNLVVRPMWITPKTALRTVPFLGKLKFRGLLGFDPFILQISCLLYTSDAADDW